MTKVLLGFAIAALAMAAPASAAPGATVTIDLSGLKAGTGDIYVSLQTREQFMKPTGSYGTIIAKPAPGRYSVSVWHDNNANRSFDRQPNGEPIDGWAMLNGDKLRAAPVFDDVSFTVDGKDQTLKLGMHYGS